MPPKRYEHIDFRPTATMAENAARGLRYRRRGGGGGLTSRQASAAGVGSGVQRAVSIKARTKLTPDTVRRMVAFFTRHAKNAKIDRGKQPWQDRGYVAFLLWGGAAGEVWARKIVRQMNQADENA